MHTDYKVIDKNNSSEKNKMTPKPTAFDISVADMKHAKSPEALRKKVQNAQNTPRASNLR